MWQFVISSVYFHINNIQFAPVVVIFAHRSCSHSCPTGWLALKRYAYMHVCTVYGVIYNQIYVGCMHAVMLHVCGVQVSSVFDWDKA